MLECNHETLGVLVIGPFVKVLDEHQEILFVSTNKLLYFVVAVLVCQYEETEQQEKFLFDANFLIRNLQELLHYVLEVVFVVDVEGREVVVQGILVICILSTWLLELHIRVGGMLLCNGYHAFFQSYTQNLILQFHTQPLECIDIALPHLQEHLI